MDNLDYIDNYFKGQLNAEEIRQFELKIEQDPVFAQDVAFYVSASGILKEQTLEATRERFSELDQAHPVKLKQSPVRRMVYYVAAAAVMIGFIITMFYLQPASMPKLADEYVNENLTQLPLPMGTEDSISLGVGYYNVKDYERALLIFKQLLTDDPTDETIIEYAGIASLRNGNINDAVGYFERLSSIDLFANPGKFYLALTLMKRNEKNDAIQAKALLNEVVKKKLSHYEQAERLLDKL